MRKTKFLILVLCLFLLAPATLFAGDFFALGVFCGGQIPEGYPLWHRSGKYEWRAVSVQPAMGWRLTDRLRAYVEGDIGVFDFERYHDVLAFGASLIGSFDLLRAKGWSLYADAGGGLGCWLGTPSDNLVGDGLAGNIKYGAGIRVAVGGGRELRVGYRFVHWSKIWWHDAGANTHGVVVGVVW